MLKKSLGIAVLIGLTTSLAHASLVIKKPVLVSFVAQVDDSTTGGVQILQPIDSPDPKIVSRSGKGINYCWVASNLEQYTGKLKVVEQFNAPKNSVFNSQSATNTHTSADGKQYTITSYQDVNEGVIMNCWEMSEEDQIGSYQLNITIDDKIKFPTLRFEVQK